MTVQKNVDQVVDHINKTAAKLQAGTATITNPATTVVVGHPFDTTAFKVTITPTVDLGAGVRFWVSNKTTTNFTINVSAAPAVSFTFDWIAREDTF